MSRAKLRSILSRLPAWGALLLGFGALIGGARADTPELRPSGTTLDPSSRASSRSDELNVRIEGDDVYISQDGTSFEKLALRDSPDAALLRKLLRDHGADSRALSVPLGAMIVASGGGTGNGDKPGHHNSRTRGNSGK